MQVNFNLIKIYLHAMKEDDIFSSSKGKPKERASPTSEGRFTMIAYTTKNDALANIREALDEHVNDYDLDAIFDAIYSYDEAQGGFVEDEDADFWGIVAANDLTMAKAEEEWGGEGYYTVAYTDGGMAFTSDGAIWCDYPEDLAAIISGANVDATETHLPVVYFEGAEDL